MSIGWPGEPVRRLPMFEQLPAVFRDPERFRPRQVDGSGMAEAGRWITPEHMVEQGVSDERVRALQAALAEARHDPGPADGEFGPRTSEAVRALQRQRGLVVDGVIGPQTMAALTAPFLQRFLEGLEGMLGPVHQTLDNLPAYASVPTAPGGVLEWLAWVVGADSVDDWDRPHQRRAVSQALDLHRTAGTVPGIAAAVALQLDLPVEEVEVADQGETSWDTDPDAELVTTPDPVLTVVVPAGSVDAGGQDLVRLRQSPGRLAAGGLRGDLRLPRARGGRRRVAGVPGAGTAAVSTAELTLSPPDAALVPGSVFHGTLTVRNTGPEVEQYTLAPAGGLAAWTRPVDAQLRLWPGDTGTVEVRVDLPRASTPPAGATTVGVTARCGDGTVAAAEEAAEVAPFAELAVLPPEPHALWTARRALVHVVVVNRGNVGLAVHLRASDREGQLAWTGRPHGEQRSLGPGESVRWPVGLTLRKVRWLGREVPLQYTAAASAPPVAGAPPEGVASGSLTQLPLVRRWWLGLALLLVVLAAFAGPELAVLVGFLLALLLLVVILVRYARVVQGGRAPPGVPGGGS